MNSFFNALSCVSTLVPLSLVVALFTSVSYANIDSDFGHKQSKQVKQLKVIRGVSSQQRTTDYFHKLLAQALKISGKETSYQLTPVDFEFSQNRTLQLLNLDGVLDITYSMTSPFREKNYIAIKVPLLNGLYGKRRLLVAAKDKARFETIEISDLKQLTACQGIHWPDYQRLKLNGFAVYGVENYQANFKMLAKGRCDYFPRGVAEIDLDFEKYNNVHGEMAKVDNIMLIYDAPVYFFVGKHNEELADIVKAGLLELQRSGRLLEVLETSNAFPYDQNFEKSPSLKVAELK